MDFKNKIKTFLEQVFSQFMIYKFDQKDICFKLTFENDKIWQWTLSLCVRQPAPVMSWNQANEETLAWSPGMQANTVYLS